MKQIEIILQPAKMEKVIDRINRYWVEEEQPRGVSIENIMGYGNQRGLVRMYRGVVEGTNIIPKTRLDIVVADNEVERIVEIISDVCWEGKFGDGKIFIRNCVDAYRIRTSEHGDQAL